MTFTSKFKKFFFEHLKLIVAILSVIVLAGIVLFYFKVTIFDNRNNDITYNLFAKDGKAVELSLDNTSEVKESFDTRIAKYYGINMVFNVKNPQSKGIVEINLKSKDTDETWKLNVSDLKSNNPTFLKFKNPILPIKNDDFVLTVKASGVDKGDLSVSAVEQATGSKSNITVGDKTEDAQFNANLVSNKRGILVKPFIIMATILLLLVAGVLAALVIKKFKNITLLCTAIFVIFATMYMFVFTPFSIPDEPMHFISAVGVSNKMMGNFSYDYDKMMIRGDDIDIYNNTSNLLSLKEYNREASLFSWKAQNPKEILQDHTPIENRELSYIAPGIGLTLGRLFGLGGYPTYYLGRFFNILFMAICLYIAMKLMPFGKLVPFCVFMFPMTLHLSASYSYDTFTIGLSMILVAQIIRLIYKKENVTLKELIITSALALIAIPYKVAYFLLAFLILLIPKEKFRSKFQNYFFKTLISVIGIGGILAVQFMKIISTANAVSSGAKNYYSMSYILKNPIYSLLLVFRTTILNGSWYFECMFGRDLGWFQIAVPSIFIYGFVIILLFAFMRKEGEPLSISFPNKCFVFLICVVSYIVVHLLLMASWTPEGASYIYGVQGRYFIPLIPAAFLIFRSDRITAKPSVDKYVVYGTSYLSVITLLAFFSLIIKA